MRTNLGKDLMGVHLPPITYVMGFLEFPYDQAVRAFEEWQHGIQSRRGVGVVRTEVRDKELVDVLRCLLPLTSVERRRFLFIPTASRWVAYLDNGHQSTDAVAPMGYLARTLKCRGIRVTAMPDKPIPGRYPARILEIYGPNKTQFLNHVRSIAVASDGGKWTFSAAGEIQDFEEPQQYSKRLIQERFTTAMLQDYLNALGLDAFDERFYRGCDGAYSASLIEKHGPSAPNMQEFQLPDVVALVR